MKFFLEVSLITRYISGPGAMGYSLSSAPSKVSVVIARRLNLPFLLFSPALVVGWTTLVLRDLRSGQPPSIVGIILFGIVTGLLVYAWLWNLCGKEKLEFTATALTWKRTLLGMSRKRGAFDRSMQHHLM